MNTTHLDCILDQYIAEYDIHNDVNGDDEGYKWRAVECFKKHWDIDAADFLTMFKNAFKEMSNLIDNASVQPVGGILLLLNHQDEIAFVKDCFEELFSEDDGDIDARQSRIELFITKMNERIEKYAKGSWKYPQLLNSTIYYLNLWRPEENYIYKATEANEWANLIEYSDDFGSGQHFSLKRYYKMCDELRSQICENEKIMLLYKERMKNITQYDDNCHIMVYDIIYCAKAYNYYKYIPTFVRMSTQQRMERVENQKTVNELQEQRAELYDTNNHLKHTMTLPDIVGTKIMHNRWGNGTVIAVGVFYITVQFLAEEKRLQYPEDVGKFYKLMDEEKEKLILAYNDKAQKIADNNAKIIEIENKLKQFS